MMKDSEVLKAAKERISKGRSEFICFGIDQCSKDALQKRRLKKWVKRMISPAITFHDWLISKRCGNLDFKKIRAHRVAWLDKLIKICESEGD